MAIRRESLSELSLGKNMKTKHSIIAILDTLHLHAIAYDFYRSITYLLDISLRRKNKKMQQQGVPDGLPLPPPHLVYAISASYDLEVFYAQSLQGATWIQDVLKKHDWDINNFKAILDFGCGCGRVMRQWHKLSGPALYGSDYNPKLVQWCQQNLPFATFHTNRLAPPLAYTDQQFDLIYTISVFTHLPEGLQEQWLKELTRILKPKGLLIITLHGEARSGDLTPEQKQLFDSGQMVVRGEKYRGSNVCGAYHPESYVRQHFIKNLTIIDVIPCGATDAGQDVYLLQKP